MSIIDTIHKRSIIRVLEPDIPERTVFCVNDARSNATLILYQLLRDADIQPNDLLTVDVRVLIERK